PSPSTIITAPMWLAYQNSFSVPAYSVVSCTEKPTLSRARMMRFERQLGVWMSNSVSSRPWQLRTIMWSVVLVLEDGDGGLLEDAHARLGLRRADGERGQQRDGLVARPGRRHEQAGREGLLGDAAGELAGGELQPAGRAAALGHEAVA